MKKIFLLSALISSMHFFVNAQIPISTARTMPLGSTVTVTGIVTNGTELGTIRYIQDATAGIAIFSSSLSSVQRGDEITVTGVTTEYQNLLEIQPVNNWILNSSNNNLPLPLLLTPLQLGENYEAQLIQINNVSFTNAGGIFQGNTTTTFTSNGEIGVVYLRNGHPLVGTTIPTSQVNLTGIVSQFSNQYQLLLRDINDIIVSSSVSITSQPLPSNITISGFDINWTTNIFSSSVIEYGKTPLLELGYLSGNNGIQHTVSITGAQPAEIYYARAISVAGNDTAFSAVKVFISQSLSSGNVKIYFNRPVAHNASYTPSNNAIYLNNSLADTIAAYINKAQQTLDIAIYNFSSTGTQLLVNAINLAHQNGVQVRIIADGGNTNSALPLLNSSIPVLNSPIGINYSIMHNKFMIIDAESSNPNQPIVWTGSTNWTNDQINIDRNNVVIVQDQSLARAFKLEFEEMWGSSTSTPNSSNSRFGQYKYDNTPHHFIIGGNWFESYFSPSDNTNSQLIEKINTADYELYYALLSLTRTDVATAIAGRSPAGAYIAGMVNDTGSGGGAAYNIIQAAANSNIALYNHASLPGILHHKYLIIDQGTATSDPLVWTGSHNWSTTANTRNDENTLVLHSRDYANQFYQEFVKMFNENGVLLNVEDQTIGIEAINLFPNPSTGNFTFTYRTDLSAAIKMRIINLTGAKVLEHQTHAHQGYNSVDMNLYSLPAGMYFLQLELEDMVTSIKLLIRD